MKNEPPVSLQLVCSVYVELGVFRYVQVCSGVTGVSPSYPSLWTPAGYRCTGPQTSGPAAEPPPETPLEHNKPGGISREPIRAQQVREQNR